MIAALPADWPTPRGPVIPPEWAWAWTAWHRLSLDRPQYGGGMGPLTPGRIPWRDVREWCDRKGGDPDELDTITRAMDEVYLAWHLERSQRNAARP